MLNQKLVLKHLIEMAKDLTVNQIDDWNYIRLGTVTVAWAKKSIKVANTVQSAAFGGYRSNDNNVAIPSGLFSETPQYAWINKQSDGSLKVVNTIIDNNIKFHFTTASGENITRTDTYNFLIIGE